METTVTEQPEDWRETMPMWAHLVWASLRKANPMYLRYSIVSFTPAGPEERTLFPEGEGGYVTVRLENAHVPREYRTTTRYLSRSWL